MSELRNAELKMRLAIAQDDKTPVDVLAKLASDPKARKRNRQQEWKSVNDCGY